MAISSRTRKLSQGTLNKLAKLGIHKQSDLILHLPLRYEDETRLSSISSAIPGSILQVQGTITRCEIVFRPRRNLICCLNDTSGELHLRFLNFYPNQVKLLSEGQLIRAIGEIRKGYFGLEMVHPRFIQVDESTDLQKTLTPIYPVTSGLSQKQIRNLILQALDTQPVDDTLPDTLLKSINLWGFADCIRFLHNPEPSTQVNALINKTHAAWRRVKFDELLSQQLTMRLNHSARKKLTSPVLRVKHSLVSRMISNLPFMLTQAQQKAFAEISSDLSLSYPMQRLLLGDVGSGKTIVAALSALQAIENGFQAALLAPTELLAEQSYNKMRKWLEPLGIQLAWLSGNMGKRDKHSVYQLINSGEAQLVIGTHALYQDKLTFYKLGLIIIDEQHRFGVKQRLAFRSKASEPHQLMMSATPIPRSLAMSYYADLDVSEMLEQPPGRTPVKTRLVNSKRRDEILATVYNVCKNGAQAYWVCPLIEESESLQLQTAIETYQQLANSFPDVSVGLVHGKLESSERSRVMSAFKAGYIHLLVATTVVEVGVDVPNASLMVIDHAERMGLAQLHQLRGRVGRGSQQSTCVLLFQHPLSELARSRLKIIYENSDGFIVAQEDLRLRGPGEMLGARQSGVEMLRFADIGSDSDLLEKARLAADKLLLENPESAHLHIARWSRNSHEFLLA